ncbi:hypothetical protein DOE63_02755 [Salmonella enterica subsp. diarizonae serovar 59:z10:-]|nr:hypothetical protein DOE63_02755 [Salmonella enterica subsp. diarizonae serovar 59:z10:-]
MKIITAKNGEFLENSFINALVHFEGFADFIPFTASPGDPEEHGRQLYADLKAGKYGPVTPFTVTPEMIQSAKDAKHAEINNWRDTQENGNYLFEYDGHKWDYGKVTQDRMSISLVMAKRGDLPADFAWTDGDNNIVPMDNAGMVALAAAIEQAMFEKGMQINLRQLQMKAEVEALTTLEDIRSYRVDWQ